MGTWKYLEHTADLLIEGEGATDREALAALTEGLLIALGGGPEASKTLESRAISAAGADRTETVVCLLSEVLYVTLVKGFVPCRGEITGLSDTSAGMTLKGEAYNPARHELHEIKAATFHDFHFGRENSGRWVVRALFDL